MKHRGLLRALVCGAFLIHPGDATSTASPGPSLAAPFVEISGEAGVRLIGRGRGSAWADIDGDGRSDLGVALQEGGFHLYVNRGGLKFEEVTAERGIPELDSPFGVAFVDVDNDGDSDLFLTCGGYQSRVPAIPQANRLLLNDGRGYFTEVPGAAGLALTGMNFSSSWCDVDNDGFLDVFICRVIDGYTKGDNRLFLNRGALNFEDVTDRAGVRTWAFSQQALFFDADQDGDPDLFFTNRHSTIAATSPHAMHGGAITGPVPFNAGPGSGEDGSTPETGDPAGHHGACSCPDGECRCVDCRCHVEPAAEEDPDEFVEYGNRLFLNNGDGTFVNVSEESGLADFEGGFPASAGDFDRDNDLDLFVGTFNYGTHAYFPGYPDRLFRNEGGGVFTEIGAAAGVASMGGPMGSAFMDFDNDGWIDLYVARGGPEEQRVESDKVYRNLGNGTFAEVSRAMGLVNKGAGHGMTAADADNDGDLDIIVPSGAMELSGLSPTLLFENSGNNNAWVVFVPRGENGNKDAVGACVSVEAGGHTTFREILAGAGFCSMAPLEAWFGLGESETVDRVTIVWRSGAVRTAERVPVRRRIRVLPPVSFAQADAVVDDTDPAGGLAAVRLSWEDPRPGPAGRFIVRLDSGDPEASGPLVHESPGPNLLLNLAPGNYTWTVDLIDDLGIVSTAGPANFTVRSAAPPVPLPADWFASPNPFGGSIIFTHVPGTEAAAFTARILDAAGRFVRELRSDAGGHAAWDGTFANGSAAPPGLYFVRLSGGGHVRTLKILRTGTTVAP